MKTKLHEVIKAIENGNNLSYDEIAPFLKSIYAYVVQVHLYEPVVLALDNKKIKIVSDDQVPEALRRESDDETKQDEILGNSRFLLDIIDSMNTYKL